MIDNSEVLLQILFEISKISAQLKLVKKLKNYLNFSINIIIIRHSIYFFFSILTTNNLVALFSVFFSFSLKFSIKIVFRQYEIIYLKITLLNYIS